MSLLRVNLSSVYRPKHLVRFMTLREHLLRSKYLLLLLLPLSLRELLVSLTSMNSVFTTLTNTKSSLTLLILLLILENGRIRSRVLLTLLVSRYLVTRLYLKLPSRDIVVDLSTIHQTQIPTPGMKRDLVMRISHSMARHSLHRNLLLLT